MEYRTEMKKDGWPATHDDTGESQTIGWVKAVGQRAALLYGYCCSLKKKNRRKALSVIEVLTGEADPSRRRKYLAWVADAWVKNMQKFSALKICVHHRM